MAQDKTISVRMVTRVPYTNTYNTGKGIAHDSSYTNVGVNVDSTIDERNEICLCTQSWE